MRRVAKAVINVIATLLGAWLLAGLCMSAPTNMPDFVDHGIRTVLRLTGNEQLANPDDMENIALAILLVACVLIAGIVVTVINIWSGRRHMKG